MGYRSLVAMGKEDYVICKDQMRQTQVLTTPVELKISWGTSQNARKNVHNHGELTEGHLIEVPLSLN